MVKVPQPIPPKGGMNRVFRRMAERTSRFMGSPFVFSTAVSLIVLWGLLGLYFEFSDTWQLFINTATTIGTFLTVILIQNTQYRDARSIQLKLDEMLRGTKSTRDSLMEIEEESDEEMDRLKEEYRGLREKYLARLEKRQKKKKLSP